MTPAMPSERTILTPVFRRMSLLVRERVGSIECRVRPFDGAQRRRVAVSAAGELLDGVVAKLSGIDVAFGIRHDARGIASRCDPRNRRDVADGALGEDQDAR